MIKIDCVILFCSKFCFLPVLIYDQYIYYAFSSSFVYRSPPALPHTEVALDVFLALKNA